MLMWKGTDFVQFGTKVWCIRENFERLLGFISCIFLSVHWSHFWMRALCARSITYTMYLHCFCFLPQPSAANEQDRNMYHPQCVKEVSPYIPEGSPGMSDPPPHVWNFRAAIWFHFTISCSLAYCHYCSVFFVKRYAFCYCSCLAPQQWGAADA